MYDPVYKDSEWMHTPAHAQMLEMFFKDSPIQIDWEFHGTQKVIEYGSEEQLCKQLVFGPWAGPKRCPTHVIHEMGHLAEIDDKRMLMTGWGLDMPLQYIPGRYSHMAAIPTTWKATQREVRVIAMAWQIQNLLGIKETPREALIAMKWMPDWCNIPARRYDAMDATWSYNDHENARYDVLEKYMMECVNGKYTLDFFMYEWKRKNELLRKALS